LHKIYEVESLLNIVHNVVTRIFEDSEPLVCDASTDAAGVHVADKHCNFHCFGYSAVFDDDLNERVLQAIIAEQNRLQDCHEILEEWNSERKKKHKVLYRWLIFIRKIYWEIEHVTKACKPKRHNKHLSWIATGTYYHYLSSDDEDSNHHCTVMRLRKVNKIINSTLRMVG